MWRASISSHSAASKLTTTTYYNKLPIFPTNIYSIGKANNKLKNIYMQMKNKKFMLHEFEFYQFYFIFFPDEVDVQEEIIYGISAISSSAKYRKL